LGAGRAPDAGGGLFRGGSILGRLGNRLKPGLPLFLVLVLGCRGIAGDSEQAKHSAIADSAANSKRQSILEEIRKLQDHEWAGEYYTGDGLGANISLAIAPKSGYVFEWDGCMGLYDKQGLRVGMELFITKPGDKVESVRITQVEEMRSEGVMTQIGEDAPGPKVGWRLSTRSPWNLNRIK
jgi:hypothetical protein